MAVAAPFVATGAVQTRRRRSCQPAPPESARQHGAAGFVVGALPVADQWSRMALAQALLSHGIVSARPDVQVKGIDAATADAQGYAEADTLCSLSVQHGPTKKKTEL